MATRVVVDDDEQQIQDLIKEMRRLRSRLATTAVKGTHDEFTAATTPATTYTLTYIPLTGTCLMALNGHVQREGTDYTCDYATGIVTVSASQASGDKITFRYLVTDWLVARSLVPDTGVEFVGSTVGDTVTGTTTSFTVNYPSGIQAGDTILAVTEQFWNPDVPSGYTSLAQAVGTGGTISNSRLTVFKRTADGTESGTGLTFTWSTGAAEPVTGGIIVYRGVGTVSTAANSSSSSQTSWATPTRSCAVGNIVVSLWGFERNNVSPSVSVTVDAATTSRGTRNVQQSVLGMADETATGTTTSARTASWSPTTGDFASATGITIVLAP